MPVPSPAERAPPQPSDADIAASFWQSLRFFSVYRLIVAAVFLVAFLLTGGNANLAAQNPDLFLWVDSAYMVAAFAFLFLLQRYNHGFNLQLTAQVICDITALTLLMYASGGGRNGIAFMLLTVVAGAGLVGQGRLTLFYAALATVALLLEQTYRFVHFGAEPEDFVRTGLTSIGFFAAAVIARALSRRVLANERLARQRGIELAEQVRINREVVEDMEDGVLVIDRLGRVRLHNPRAQVLLGAEAAQGTALEVFSPPLARYLREHQPGDGGVAGVLRLPDGATSLQVRVVRSGQGENALIYLQDLGRLQAQAQQIKLAALGRLTANIAHEIRNPLSSISNAGELLADEQRAEIRLRLLRIIRDNSKRLNRLVSEVLELGRRDRAEPEGIEIVSFLRQFVDEYALQDPTVQARVRLAVDGSLCIQFDRSHLHRVLENLVTNALRYASAATGAICVSAQRAAAGRIELHVVDDGTGISAADRVKVFEPFFTTRGSGTGLGLYIARELCDANGAQIDLMDAGAGTDFRILARGGTCPEKTNVAA